MGTSTYQRPGVYISEQIRTVLAAFGSYPRALCLVGEANKLIEIKDEAVRRGYVVKETITPASSSPYAATLAYKSNELKVDTVLYRDDVVLDEDAYEFDDANHITILDFGYNAGSVYKISYQAIALSAPSKDPLLHTDVTAIRMVGPYPRVSSYIQGTDFQLTTNQVDWSLGGAEPNLDTFYYVTYQHKRDSVAYNVPKLAFSLDEVLNDVGALDANNMIGIGAQIAFQQNIPFVWYCQVKDADDNGQYTKADYMTAIDGCKLKEELTDICVLMPTYFSPGDYDIIQAYLRQHVIDESNPYTKHERLGWFGRKVSTPVGDKTTVYSFVYTAVQMLQASSSSPGRGRMILVGPSYCQKTVVMESGTELTMTLDSSFLACAVAAKQNSFDNVSDSLLRKTFVGFDSIEEWSPEEVDYCAANGICVVSYVGGNFILLDPISTEKNPSSIEFAEISAMCQKDLITRRMRDYLDENIIGIVPDDLDDFLWDIKAAVMVVLKSAISDGIVAPYFDEDGISREIDTTKDIEVKRDVTDATKYVFKYWYNLKYPAKRLFGLYTVDTPFYSQKG